MVLQTKEKSWSNLPPELLELILQKLVVKDYLKCRRVCRWWRSAVNDALKTKNRCPPAPQFPYLLIISRFNEDPAANLLDITQNKSQSIPTHDWEGNLELVQSEEGWLMFQDTYFNDKSEGKSSSLFWIFNPVSGEKYELPPLSWYSNICAPNIIATIFSPAPDPQNFLVAVYLSEYRWNSPSMAHLYFCRVTDKSWTRIEQASMSTIFTGMVLLDWKIYAINTDKTDFVTVFDLRDPNALTAERLDIHFPVTREATCISMMAKDSTSGEVLLVIISTKLCDREIKEIQVFKLDMSNPRWIKVDNFNERALLIDSEGARVISTTKHSGTPEYIKENCVLFSVQYWLYPCSKYDFGIFFLKDKTIRLLPANLLKASNRSLWFTPHLW